MKATEDNRLVIRWVTRDVDAIAAIRKRFGMSSYTTVNGWTPCEIKPEDRELFEECARRGFFGILNEKWQKNGGQYVFISR